MFSCCFASKGAADDAIVVIKGDELLYRLALSLLCVGAR